MTTNALLTGWGMYAPERVMTNAELSTMVDTSDEWIVTRTGIRERRVAADDETATSLSVHAARDALAVAGLDPAELDLVIGAEVISRFLDWTDRNTCVLFGDGAGAVLLQASDRPGGLLGFELFADGAGAEMIIVPGGGSASPASPATVANREHFIRMSGRDVYKYATRQLAESTLAAVRNAGLTIADVDQFVFHQANLRIIESVARQLGIPADRSFVNIGKYGNTSAASVPMALVEAVAAGRIKQGDRVLMVAFGAGYTAGAALVEWTADPSRAFLAPGDQTRLR